jgi:hypothetical protein
MRSRALFRSKKNPSTARRNASKNNTMSVRTNPRIHCDNRTLGGILSFPEEHFRGGVRESLDRIHEVRRPDAVDLWFHVVVENDVTQHRADLKQRKEAPWTSWQTSGISASKKLQHRSAYRVFHGRTLLGKCVQ